jgi:hypothetical protein
MVITFPSTIVADAAAYAEAASLPDDDRTTAGPGDAPRRRRDLAVPVFVDMVDAARAGDNTPLLTFLDAAASLVRPRLAEWGTIWRDGPLASADATGAQLAALASGDAGHLRAAAVRSLPPPPGERRFGCCGTLGTYVVAG